MRKDVLWPAATCMAVVLAITAAISLRRPHDETQGGGKPAELREALRQEPASPYRWCDLGEALLEDGQKEKARYCIQQAEKLAPNFPAIWMRAAFFHFQVEETDAAIQCSSRVLKMAPDYHEAIFNYFDRLAPNVEAVLPHMGDNRPAGQAYFRNFWERRRREGPQQPGSGCGSGGLRMTGRPPGTSTCCLQRRKTEEAVEVWASYLGSRRGDYPDSNMLFHGDFESPPTGAALDWRITAVRGAETAREDQGARSGHWTLHVSFQGTENVSYRHAVQTVCARTGEYVFQAYARTRDPTTDEGIRCHIFDAESSARLDVHTEQLRGTNDWTRLEKKCRIRAGTRLIMVEVCRMPSWKLDNKIRGEAWLDDVSLKAAH